jgi:hypothetical protein
MTQNRVNGSQEVLLIAPAPFGIVRGDLRREHDHNEERKQARRHFLGLGCYYFA